MYSETWPIGMDLYPGDDLVLSVDWANDGARTVVAARIFAGGLVVWQTEPLDDPPECLWRDDTDYLIDVVTGEWRSI